MISLLGHPCDPSSPLLRHLAAPSFATSRHNLLLLAVRRRPSVLSLQPENVTGDNPNPEPRTPTPKLPTLTAARRRAITASLRKKMKLVGRVGRIQFASGNGSRVCNARCVARFAKLGSLCKLSLWSLNQRFRAGT